MFTKLGYKLDAISRILAGANNIAINILKSMAQISMKKSSLVSKQFTVAPKAHEEKQTAPKERKATPENKTEITKQIGGIGKNLDAT